MPLSSTSPRSPGLASALVAGAVAVALGTAPVAAASPQVAEPIAEPTVRAVPRFVQEGTPVDVGGQALPWGAGLGLRPDDETDYAWELPPGVTHTAISTGSTAGGTGMTMVLRSDGQVVGLVESENASEPVIPALPDGLEYTAVSAGESGASFLLRSDGSLVTVVRGTIPSPQVPALPAGMSYTAVDVGLAGAYAVRSDGRIVGIKVGSASSLPLTCTDAFVPPNGLAYTAVNADHLSWAALRSDGAIVYCRFGASGGAEVIAPAEGTSFTGVAVTRGLDNNSKGYGYGARDDGTIVGFGAAPIPANVPAGRTVVGLAAYVEYPNSESVPGGAAVLDDGSIVTWGGASSALPPEIPGTPGFVGVANFGSAKWLIRVGEAIPVELSVSSSTTVNHNESTNFTVTVTAGGVHPSGYVRMGYVLGDGTTTWDSPKRVVDGLVTLRFGASPEGTYRRMLRFDGPPFATARLAVDFVVQPQRPSTLTVDMPDSWRTGARDVHAQIQVEAEGGVSTEQGTLRVVAEETGEQLNVGFAHEGSYWLDTTVLPVGTQRIRVEYVSDGPAASTSWVGSVEVLPPGETETFLEGDPTGAYSEHGAYVKMEIAARSKDGSRLGHGYLEVLGEDGEALASTGGLFDGSEGVVRGTVYLPVDGRLPGTYPVTVAWAPDAESMYFKHSTPETRPSRSTDTVTVVRAASSIDMIPPRGLVHGEDGSVEAWVGSHSRVREVSGELVARIAGVEVGRAAAAGRSVPLDLGDVLPGSYELEISYSGSALLEPSSATEEIQVGLGRFSATSPGITGTPRVGETLRASSGTWVPKPSSTSYVWKADGEVLPGENAASLVVPASALGKRISVAVSGKRANYRDHTVTSSSTSEVGGIFVVSKLPTISGTAQVGKTLTAAKGIWDPAPQAVRYQWMLSGKPVLGATSRTWKLSSSAKGKRVTVAVTAIATGYPRKSAVSPATAAVKAGVFVAPTPTIAGTARVGSTLQVYRGTWTPLPSTVTHQWRIDGRSVVGATRSTFRVPSSARGKRVSVVVTGSLAGYTTKSVSRSTGLIR